MLDANENAHGPGLDVATITGTTPDGEGAARNGAGVPFDVRGLNRYPDPHQTPLKQRICDYRNAEAGRSSGGLQPSNLFVGVGSDEAIDAVLRCFCRPGHDKILICPPTYGMYSVSAHVNDLSVVHVPLDEENGFVLRPSAVKAALSEDPSVKVVYLCSPGNPTGRLISGPSLEEVLRHPTWNGVVVLDEAYVDFSAPGSSLAQRVLDHPNLIVMQTLSKAFGLAGIRLGVAITSPPVARLLNNLKAPYNVSSITSALATAAFSPAHLATTRRHRAAILAQRDRLVEELPRIPGVGRFRGGLDANFVLVEMLSSPSAATPDNVANDSNNSPSNAVALAVYTTLAEKKGVVVRFRGKEHGCNGCLRITVGTADEVTMLLRELRTALGDVHRASGTVVSGDASPESTQGGAVDGIAAAQNDVKVHAPTWTPTTGSIEVEQEAERRANDVLA